MISSSTCSCGVKRKFPGVLLSGRLRPGNAGRLLDIYHDQLCTFNDDIQGTAAVTTGTLLGAVAVAGGKLHDQRVAILGAGSAGCGIAEQLVAAMVDEGLPEREARANFFLIDRPGLLHDGLQGLRPFQRNLVQPKERVDSWRPGEGQPIGLLEVIKHAKPTILIGVSGQPGTFSEQVVRAMGEYARRPIIFPLSNPTSRSEATPADLLAWTDGRALIATGSPYDDVSFGGRKYSIAQCSNGYIFPAVGLGVRASGGARRRMNAWPCSWRRRGSTGWFCSGPSRSDGAIAPPLSESRRCRERVALDRGRRGTARRLLA